MFISQGIGILSHGGLKKGLHDRFYYSHAALPHFFTRDHDSKEVASRTHTSPPQNPRPKTCRHNTIMTRSTFFRLTKPPSTSSLRSYINLSPSFVNPLQINFQARPFPLSTLLPNSSHPFPVHIPFSLQPFQRPINTPQPWPHHHHHTATSSKKPSKSQNARSPDTKKRSRRNPRHHQTPQPHLPSTPKASHSSRIRKPSPESCCQG